jgi:eukaryotic-like serine/threonine-protein kinase
LVREGAVLDGKYRIDRRLAEGGMGVVFVAEHLMLKKPVAVKVLHATLGDQPEAVERFTIEARAASLIDHENVVRISDFGRSDGELYLVMELLEGHDLADELEREGPLPVTRARFIAAQVLRGLGAAHARGVVHRDLKPENVFIARRPGADDVVKILDFGIARMRQESDLRLTRDGAIMGTPFYMAPEQLRAQRDVDARADLYAVGVILYEMLAGVSPYTGNSFSEVAHAIIEGRPRPLDGVDPVLSAIIMKAFAGARDARFQTAGELLAALERHRIDEPLAPSPWSDPRTSQLIGVPGPDNATLREKGLAATMDGSTANPLDRETRAPAAPTVSEQQFLPPTDEPALELDRPPPPAAPAETPAPRRIATWLVVIFLLGFGGVLAVAYFSAPPPPPITVRIVDLPRGAQVFVDGAATTSTFTLPGDRRQHRVRLHATGYTDKGLMFMADGDQSLDGQMRR